MRRSFLLNLSIFFVLLLCVEDANAQGAVVTDSTTKPVIAETTAQSQAGPEISQQLRQRGIGRAIGQNQSIFAFPAAQCPPGSNAYKGPEAKLAALQGVSYCVFTRRIVVLPKDATGGKCPGALTPYAGTEAQPDADVIWCEMPRNGQGGGQQGQQGQGRNRSNR